MINNNNDSNHTVRKTNRILSKKHSDISYSLNTSVLNNRKLPPANKLTTTSLENSISLPILHPWSNGVLLSELVANLLLDDKSLIKEVEQYDRYGRLMSQPKLLLSGSEAVVKSKAQAIHNIQLSLQHLRQIPNFPIIDNTAEEIYFSETLFITLLRMIQKAFQLPYTMNSNIEEIMASIKHRRILVHRQPRINLPGIGSRSFSAPPTVFMQAMRAVSFDEGFPRAAIRSKSIEPMRRTTDNIQHQIRSSRNTSTRFSGNQLQQRWISPEPEIRRSAPQPTPPSQSHNQYSPKKKIVSIWEKEESGLAKGKLFMESKNKASIRRYGIDGYQPDNGTTNNTKNPNDDRCNTPTKLMKRSPDNRPIFDHVMDANNKVQQVRNVESRKERLQVQKRDRSVRRRSLLSFQEKDHFSNLKLKIGEANTSKFSGDEKCVNLMPKTKRANLNNHSTSPLVIPSSSAEIHRCSQPSASPNDWPISKISVLEAATLRKLPVPQVTMAQMTAVKQWLQNSCQLPILDGEGGFYSHNEIRNVNSSHFVSSGSNTVGNSSGMVAIPPPLPLSQDRLRNGIFWCLLFHVLEPAVSKHTQLLQHTVHKYCLNRNRYSTSYRLNADPNCLREMTGINTIDKAENILSKVFWLWRIKSSPPLSLLYLGQIDQVIKCHKDVIWGLLFELYQLYGTQKPNVNAELGTNNINDETFTHLDRFSTVDVNIAFPFGNTKPLTANFHAIGTEIVDGVMGIKTLPYTPLQRRSLDLSLVHWLNELGVLREVLGTWNAFPTSLSTLESYIKDGTLLGHMLHKVFHLPLPPSQIITHPHTYSQCISNLSKVIKLLNSCLSFPSRFIYSGAEEDISRGNWDVIYGLFEDLHLFYDFWQDFYVGNGDSPQPVQKLNLKFPTALYPYLGSNSRQLLDTPHRNSSNNNLYNRGHYSQNIHLTEEVEVANGNPNSQKSTFQPTLDLRASYDLDHEKNDVSFLFNKENGSANDLIPGSGLPTLAVIPAMRPLQESTHITEGGKFTTKAYPSVADMTALDPAMRFLGINEDIRHDIRSSPYSQLVNKTISVSVEGMRSGRTSIDSDHDPLLPKEYFGSREDDTVEVRESLQNVQPFPTIIPKVVRNSRYDNENEIKLDNNEEEVLSSDDSQVAILLQSIIPWLHELIGYPNVSSPFHLQENIDRLGNFFKDGAAFARLLQKLTRITLTGIEMKPKSSGQKTQNIRKCLELLTQSNKRIPARVLNCEEALLLGNGTQILRLLIHIKRAFPSHKPN